MTHPLPEEMVFGVVRRKENQPVNHLNDFTTGRNLHSNSFYASIKIVPETTYLFRYIEKA